MALKANPTTHASPYILYLKTNGPQYTGQEDKSNDFLTAVNKSLQDVSNSLPYPGLRRNTPASTASNTHEDNCHKSRISSMFGNQNRQRF